uniref:Uncharacterized protein n=1 Tax=Eptatretus burgeri TaxID=7764 RepID=A0A8C4N3N9_EPTBU
MSKAMMAVWQRWSRLHSSAREQEGSLQSAVEKWKQLTDKVQQVSEGLKDLQMRIPERPAEAASQMELKALRAQAQTIGREMEQEQAGIAVLLQQVMLLQGRGPILGEATEEHPVAQNLQVMQANYETLRRSLENQRLLLEEELLVREEVERELGNVKSWLQESASLLHGLDNSTYSDQLSRIREIGGGMTQRHHITSELAKKQQAKYQRLGIAVPEETVQALADVSYALQAFGHQVHEKEKEAEQALSFEEEFENRISEISEELESIEYRLKEKAVGLQQAVTCHQSLWDELNNWLERLTELDAAVQELFGQASPHSERHNKQADMLSQRYQQARCLAEHRDGLLAKACGQMEKYEELKRNVEKWVKEAEGLVMREITWNSASQIDEHLAAYKLLHQDSARVSEELDNMWRCVLAVEEVCGVERMAADQAQIKKCAEVLQLNIQSRLHTLEQASEAMEVFSAAVKALQAAVQQAQAVFTTPEVAQLSLKEQLMQCRQLLAETEHVKNRVEEVQQLQGNIKLPAATSASQPICSKAQILRDQASCLQHTVIRQISLLQEAEARSAQYDVELQKLQELLEEAQREGAAEKIQSHKKTMIALEMKKQEVLSEVRRSVSQLPGLHMSQVITSFREDPAVQKWSGEERSALLYAQPELAKFTVQTYEVSQPDSAVLESQQTLYQEASKEDTNDLHITPSPDIKEWVATAKTHRDNNHQQQKELEQELAEQKNLLKCVASRGERLLSQNSENGVDQSDMRSEISGKMLHRRDSLTDDISKEPEEGFRQMKRKWEILKHELVNKQMILQEALKENSSLMTYVRPTQDVDETDITEPSRDIILSFTGLENIFDISISNLQNLTPEQSLDLEQKMHKHIKQKTFWMDIMEAKTMGSAAVSPKQIDAQLIMQEILLKDIAKMSHEVNEKKNRFCEAYPKDTGNGQLIVDTLDRLWQRLQTVDKAVRHQMNRLRNRVSEVTEYQTQLSILHNSLANHKQLVLDTLSDEPNKKAWEQLQDLENLASKLRWFEMQISMIRVRQQKLYEEPANVQDMHNLQALLEELQGLVSEHRPTLSKHHVAESRYEQALSDMTELLCAGEDKMASTCSVDKPQGLAVWLKQHKEFFHGLGHLMLMVDKLADRSSSSCQQRLDPRRAQLMGQASSLLAQSQKQGREQQQVLQAWEDIEEEYKTLSQILTGMEALVPSDRVQEETEQEIMDHINIYQNLKSSLELSQPRLQHLLESGRKLQDMTKHHLPDSHLVDLGERWLACSALVTTELQCLQNMLHHWVSFQQESAELEHWLNEAQTHVTFWAGRDCECLFEPTGPPDIPQ